MELDELLHDAEIAHGHLCAGQILGVRMAMLALGRLGIEDPRSKASPDRKRLVTFVEIDRCATDAIGVVTGCRVGKRALKLRDWGKMAATFVDLSAPLGDDAYKGLRVVALESSKARAKEIYPELEKMRSRCARIANSPNDELFSEQWVRVPLPPSELPGYKGQRVTCAECGEGINFDRFVHFGGDLLCLGCAEPSQRYYEPLS